MTIEYKDSKRIVALSSDRTQGLKAYYHFEDNGTNAQTTILGLGSSADMTVTGATYATGKVGSKAISFDGTNDYAVIGSSTSDFNFLANTTHEWTVAFWFKNATWGTGLEMILSTGVELSSARYGLGIRAETGGVMRVHFCNGTNTNRFVTTQSGFSTDGNWHFIVITAKKSDSTNSLEFWEDGTSLGTASNSGKDFVDTDASQAPYIGQAGDSSQWLSGQLDELSIWNRRLSDSEISTLYNSGTGIVIGSTDIVVGNTLSNVQDNSLLVEKDVARRYWFSEGTSVTNQDIEWTNGNNVTISGNTLTATAGGWSCIARSVQTISPSRGGGTVIGKHSVNYGMLGFSKDPYWTSGNTFANGDYMIYHDEVYELGTAKSGSSFSGADNNTLYKVTMDSNGLVKYFVDTGSGYTEVYESTVTAGSNDEYYVLGVPDGSGSTVSDITITGKITADTWTKQNPELPTVSGLYVHYDATDVNSITKDSNNRISQWNDKSGGERHLTQATSGNQPLWIASDEAGNPVIDFSDDRYMNDTWSAQSLPNTIFIVARLPVATASRTNIISGASGNAQSVFGDGSNTWKYAAGSAQGGTKTGIEDTWQYIYALYGDDYTFEIGGDLISGANCGSDTWTGMEVGASSGSQFGNMKIGEIIGYNVAVKGDDKTAIINYLKKKWERT